MPTRQPGAFQSSAAEFCEGMPLGDESVALMTSQMSVPEFLEALIQHEQHIDAAQVLARMLSPRDGVWWAAQCVAASFNEKTRPQEIAALRAVEKWVDDLEESSRYAAFEAGQDARLGSPANCVAMAVFASGPSLAPPGKADVPPAPGLSAQLVASTVMAAGLTENPDESRARMVQFLDHGRSILPAAAAIPA